MKENINISCLQSILWEFEGVHGGDINLRKPTAGGTREQPASKVSRNSIPVYARRRRVRYVLFMSMSYLFSLESVGEFVNHLYYFAIFLLMTATTLSYLIDIHILHISCIIVCFARIIKLIF